MIFLISILTSFLLGILLCKILFKEFANYAPRFLVNSSIPIGIGVSSIIFIVFNLLGVSTLFVILIEIVFILFLFYKYGNPFKSIIKNTLENKIFSINTLAKNPLLLLLVIVYFYSLLLDIGVYYFDSVKEPHGLWDAWADWNLGAKMIGRDPVNWPDSFHQLVSEDFHTDYPLLQKGYIARCWILLKNETVWIPIAFSFIFTFCAIGLLSAAVSYFTNKIQGLIAGLILLCTPFFMLLGDSQYADNTVGYFFLASIVLLTLARKDSATKPGLLIASGLTAGLAAWSKNEGLLFIVCLLTSQLTLLFFKNPKELFTEVKYLIIGMLPILALIIYQKIAISPPNQIVVGQGPQTLIKIKDFSRYEIIWSWYKEQFVIFGQWAFNPWWLFLLGILFKGGISIKKYSYSFIANVTWLILMLVGFFIVEIITPLDLVFYLSTSLHRLFAQLFPSFIFIYFVALKNNSTVISIPNGRTRKQNGRTLKNFKLSKIFKRTD